MYLVHAQGGIMSFLEKLFDELKEAPGDEELEMAEVVSGSTIIDLTASSIDISDDNQLIDKIASEKIESEK